MGLIVAVAILTISRMPDRILFSVLFGALTFLIFMLIQNDANPSAAKLFNLRTKFEFKLSRKFFVLAVYAVSIVVVLLIPSDSSSQFVNWLSIPAVNYIRLVAGLLLSSILPGYGLFRLIDRKRRFNGLASLVFSFFISLFLMALTTYATIVANVPISNIYWLTLILNLAIFAGFSLTFVKKHEVVTDKRNESSVSHRIDYLIIACILLFFVIGWIVYYSSYQLGSTGDMWDHYYTVLQVSKGGLFSSSHLSYLGDETWFSLHFIAFFQLTGFPSLNGWMTYAFINFFYVLAFYLMVRGIIGDKYPKLPVIATVIATLFAGFGWIEALFLASKSIASNSAWLSALYTAGSNTYNDIIYSFIYGPIPEYFSLSVLFVLIYLMTSKRQFSVTNVILTVVLVVQGLLVHSPEIIFFTIFYFCFIFFSNREDLRRLKNFSFSILLGLLIVFVIGLPFSSHFYFDMTSILPLLFILIGLSFVPIYLRTKNTMHLTFPSMLRDVRARINSFTFSRTIGIFILCIVWIFYGLSFFAWNSTLNDNITSNLGAVGLKPWYIYPISSGVSLLLGLMGLTFIILDKKTKLVNAKFLALSLALFFVAGIILSFANISFNLVSTTSTYWEKRLYPFMLIPLSIFGAFFITQVSSKIHFISSARKFRPIMISVIVGLLIAIVLVSGVASSVLALDYVSLTSQGDPLASCSKAELQALDFLRTNASSDATVLGLSTDSNRLAYVFSGLNHLNSPYWFTGGSFQYIDVTNPELALKILYSLNVTYLFATKSDLETLQSSGYVVTHLLKYLPVAFKNTEVTIYQVPKLDPPSSESNLTLVIPSFAFDALSNSNGPTSSNSTFYFPIDMLAESGLDYSIKIAEDGSLFNSNYIVLPSDKGWTDGQISEYLAWVNNGGHLIILNGDGLGDFAKVLSLYSNSDILILANRLSSQTEAIRLAPLSVPSLLSTDSQVSVLASYDSQNNQSVPLMLAKSIGAGEILYLNIEPFFENILSFSTTGSSIFLQLGNLLHFLKAELPYFREIAPGEGWKYLQYDSTIIRNYLQLEGSAEIQSNSIIFANNQLNVDKLEIVNATGTFNGYNVQTTTSEAVTISNLKTEGAISFALTSSNLSIVPMNYGAYAALILNPGFDLAMQITNGTIDLFLSSQQNETNELILNSGTLLMQGVSTISTSQTFNTSNYAGLSPDFMADSQTLVFARTPSVNIEGTAFFSEAFIPTYINYVTGNSVQIKGTTHFDFDCSSDNVILLTNFAYSGLFSIYEPKTTEISMFSWEFPHVLLSDITSPGFLIFLISFLLVIIVINWRRPKPSDDTAAPRSRQKTSFVNENKNNYKH